MERLKNGGLAAWGGCVQDMYMDLNAAVIAAETKVATRPKTPFGGEGKPAAQPL